MGVPRGTTPTFSLTLTDVDLTQADSVYVTFAQGRTVITKTGDDLTVSATAIEVALSQEETLRFYSGHVQIQANWIVSGLRFATDIAQYAFTRQLLQEVLE